MEAPKTINQKVNNEEKCEQTDKQQSENSKTEKPVLEILEKEQENVKKGARKKKKKGAKSKGTQSAKSDTETEPESPHSPQTNTDSETPVSPVPVQEKQIVDKDRDNKDTTVVGSDENVPESLLNNVLKHSAPLPSNTPTVKGLFLKNTLF